MENAIIREITGLAEKIDNNHYERMHHLLKKVKRVFVAGAGRSGLIGKCFAMRLRHLGIESYAVGETICPPIQKGDLLVIISCSGDKKTLLALAGISKEAGAETICITCNKNNPLARLCSRKLVIPAEKSVQFGNSLFEQAVFIFLETFVERYRKTKKISAAQMMKRHANME